MVNIRHPVLDLKRFKVEFIKPDLTLTFDPATLTLVQILALIYANLMCESYQDSHLLLATTNPQTFVIVGYKTLLGGTLAVVALQKQWQIRGVSWFRNGTNVVEFLFPLLGLLSKNLLSYCHRLKKKTIPVFMAKL